ncbi:MAG: GIY-YIG nuclease family protein [Gammaproteobacteria bacterium]|nr:MAG: GIY-YIG nuclease family protein [Gammaproteobacteria bacterium]
MWYVYILECADHTFYTGITTNLDERLREHNEGNGARYTRGRRPLRLVYSEDARDRSEAQSHEYRIKQLSRKEKSRLIAGGS